MTRRINTTLRLGRVGAAGQNNAINPNNTPCNTIANKADQSIEGRRHQGAASSLASREVAVELCREKRRFMTLLCPKKATAQAFHTMQRSP